MYDEPGQRLVKLVWWSSGRVLDDSSEGLKLQYDQSVIVGLCSTSIVNHLGIIVVNSSLTREGFKSTTDQC